MDTAFEIGARIKDLRSKKRLTLKNVADSVGVNVATVQRYEKGFFSTPNSLVVEKIARVLEVNPEWLMGVSENREPDRTVTLSELEFAFYGAVRELDDDDREELLRNAERMRELKRLRNKGNAD